MSSFAQVVVGGVLLVTAFLFGRYINDQPILQPSDATKVATSESLNRQISKNDDVQAPPQNGSNALQRTLRERILGERIKNRSPQQQKLPERSAPDKQAAVVADKSPFQLPEQEIVVPNFSHLELDPVDPANQNESQKFANDMAINKPLPPKSGSTHQERMSRLTFPKESSSVSPNIPPQEIARRPKEIPDPTKKLPLKTNSEPRTNSKEMSIRRGKFKSERPKNSMVPVRHRESKLTTESEKFLSYKTVFGDTLHSISSHFFGKPDYYLDIYLANKDQLVNPATVPVNRTLRIPVMDKLIHQK